MKNITKNTVIFLVSTLLCFLVLEALLRIYNPFQWRVKGDKIILPVNRKYIFDNDKIDKLDRKIIHSKNSLGFRGENPPKNFSDYLSIVIVGGSTAECFYLSDGRDWPYLVGQKLKNIYDKVWVNNAGLAGHSTFGHIILVNDYLTRLKPKIIIFEVGANDIGRDDLGKYDRVALKGRYSSFKNFIVKNSEVVSLLANMVRLAKAQKMGITHRNLDVVKADKLVLPEGNIEKEVNHHKSGYIDGYKKRLLQLVDICRKNRIEPIFVTQPILCGNTVDATTEVDLGDVKLSDSMNGNLCWRIMQVYNNATKEVAGRTGTFVIDLASEMPKDSRYFYDNWHYTNEGAEKVSQIVFEKLKNYLDVEYKANLKK
ncbi:MAG: SGNH/GDSL hydrolase family protein [Candidatus Omnitrophica bacterium]|nr:SGNH/GDSL hydrolase family protein [Candidatus Omnitrophota bacterium]